MHKDGYIKYHFEWNKANLDIDSRLFDKISTWRRKVYEESWIGIYEDGVGFGNLSLRLHDDVFCISGSATGGKKYLNSEDYALVQEFNLSENRLKCMGQTAASSESLSHAALYKGSIAVNCIIHIHDLKLWEKHLNKLPTTSKEISYGSPQMAYELQRIQSMHNPNIGIIIMGGHKEGIIAYGACFDQVFTLLKDL